MNRISYSQVRMYQECGKKYQYYYKDRLRERTKSGALFFGVAVETACQALLKDKTVDAKNVFDIAWSKGDINGVIYDLPLCPLIGYSAYDFDYDVLTEEDIRNLEKNIQVLCPSLLKDDDAFIGIQRSLADKKKQNDNGYRKWAKGEQEILNLFNWLSLRRKAHVMLDSFITDILPKIKEVKSIQKQINLHTEHGDEIIGFCDLECVWQENENTKPKHVIFDFKTSGFEYDEDEVKLSQQLALYCFATEISTAGYIVFVKKLEKEKEKVCSQCSHNGNESRHKTCNNVINNIRCNGTWISTLKSKARIQVLIDEIPRRTEEIVMENFAIANKGIKDQNFIRNFSNCKGKYGHCPYLKVCYNDNKDGLITVKESERK